VLSDAVAFALGGVPISVVWLVYNWRVTGNPLLTTMLWASPDQQTFGILDLGFPFINTAKLAILLLVFAGVVPNVVMI
jgi:hypothetical protein